MIRRILYFLILTVVLCSCSEPSFEVRTACSRDNIGNYLVKWETFPAIKGNVAIFVSSTPNHFNLEKPAIVTDVENGVSTYITKDNTSRRYFLLRFDNGHTEIVSNRSVLMENIVNFRDIGGYKSRSDKQLKWGKIYRSGQVGSPCEIDSKRLQRLGIKTIVDLRDDEDFFTNALIYDSAQIVRIPITAVSSSDVLHRIKKRKLRRGDANILIQDTYLCFMDSLSEEFGKAIEVAADPDNYPILYTCTLGKDRVGFLVAFLMAALDMPNQTIREDYISSNQYMKFSFPQELLNELDLEAQETISTLVSCNEANLNIVFNAIKRDYGSVNNYLEKKMNLDSRKRAKLRELLLN